MSNIVAFCGLEGSGKTTASELFCTEAPLEWRSTHEPVCDIVTRIIFGDDFTPEDRARIDALLRATLDPKYDSFGPIEYRYPVRSEESNHIYFSFAVKQIAMVLFGFSWELVAAESPEMRLQRETTHSTYTYEYAKKLTAREALRYIGTEMFRDSFDENIWIKLVYREVGKFPDRTFYVSDLRFYNEADAIRNSGGIIIQLYRDPADLELTDELRRQHPSVWSFLTFRPKFIWAKVHNDGTKGDLRKKLLQILERAGVSL